MNRVCTLSRLDEEWKLRKVCCDGSPLISQRIEGSGAGSVESSGSTIFSAYGSLIGANERKVEWIHEDDVTVASLSCGQLRRPVGGYAKRYLCQCGSDVIPLASHDH